MNEDIKVPPGTWFCIERCTGRTGGYFGYSADGTVWGMTRAHVIAHLGALYVAKRMAENHHGTHETNTQKNEGRDGAGPVLS